MLKQRVITALVLLAILLPALFAPQPQWFMAVALVLIVLAAWEWGQLNGYSQQSSWWIALACLVLCGVAWKLNLAFHSLPAFWVVSGGAWVLLGAWLLRQGVPAWGRVPRWVRVTGGVLLLALAWLAVARARVLGINVLLSILALVWGADVFAYFAGRRFGQRKLAPSISPGKSWEGVWGGIVGVFIIALVWIFVDKSGWGIAQASFYTRLVEQSWWWLILALLLMCAMSVVGDLVESLVKRSAGAKDSSQLLPGHGGVLDRVDALLPTVPLAMMLLALLGK